VRILAAIPHYYRPTRQGRYGSLRAGAETRLVALSECIMGLRRTLGTAQGIIDIASRTAHHANQALAATLDIVVCTCGEEHLLNRLRLPAGSFRHLPTAAMPGLLGYSCHELLLENLGRYDWYCYVEDDIVVADPLFLDKLAWFCSLAGNDALLMPNRFERAWRGPLAKVYVDGDLRPDVTRPFLADGPRPVVTGSLMGRSVRFVPALNPNSGCFFLTGDQMRKVAALPGYPAPDASFVGPLESACNLAVMRALRIYKPAVENAGFLEVEHHAQAFAGLVGREVRLGPTFGSLGLLERESAGVDGS